MEPAEWRAGGVSWTWLARSGARAWEVGTRRGHLIRAPPIPQVCRARRIPVIFDEVFTGCWRLGAPTAGHILGVAPDIACYAKLLTAGVAPLAVTLASEEVFQAFEGSSKVRRGGVGAMEVARYARRLNEGSCVRAAVTPHTSCQKWQLPLRHRPPAAMLGLPSPQTPAPCPPPTPTAPGARAAARPLLHGLPCRLRRLPRQPLHPGVPLPQPQPLLPGAG
jgi:hypothetical protein